MLLCKISLKQDQLYTNSKMDNRLETNLLHVISVNSHVEQMQGSLCAFFFSTVFT